MREFVLSCHNFVVHLPPKYGSELDWRSECLQARIHRDSEFNQVRLAAKSEFDKVDADPETHHFWPMIRNALENPESVWEPHSHQTNSTRVERFSEFVIDLVEQTLGTANGFRRWHLQMKSLQILEQDNRAIGSQLLIKCHHLWRAAAEGLDVEKLREFVRYLLEHFDQYQREIVIAADALVTWKPAGKPARKKKQHQTVDGAETSPLLTVNSWSDLGIGIHPNGNFLAFQPLPDCGSRVRIGGATELPLAGGRWKKVGGHVNFGPVWRWVAVGKLIGFHEDERGSCTTSMVVPAVLAWPWG